MPNDNKNAQGSQDNNNQKTGQKQGQDSNTDPNRGSNQPNQSNQNQKDAGRFSGNRPIDNNDIDEQRRSGYDLDVDTDAPSRKNASEADQSRRDPSRQGQGQDDSRSAKKRP